MGPGCAVGYCGSFLNKLRFIFCQKLAKSGGVRSTHKSTHHYTALDSAVLAMLCLHRTGTRI